MEERIPTSDDTKTKLPPPPPGAAASLETYVVQIPRDQIYRVPPPDHARIVEEHKRNSLNQEANRRSFFCSYAIPVVLIAIIAGIAVLTVRATLYRPAKPEFAVTHIQGKNLEHHLPRDRRPPEFKITIQANNPNTRMPVSYKEGGEATLAFKGKEIGKGKIPSTINEGTSGAADLAVALVGNGAPLSKEIEKSLNDDKEKSMELTIDLPVEMKSWVRNELMNLKISCDFRVSNSLMNNTKISFQECKTES